MAYQDSQRHLFILSGQSNMERLDPDISFTPTVEKAFGKENVSVVKDAEGGQPIRRWYRKWRAEDGSKPESTGDLYDRLMLKVHEAIQGNEFDTTTFVWMQGERDACDQQGKVYAASLRGLMEQLSNDLGGRDVNVVIGRLSDYDMENKKYAHWTMVREIQVEFAEKNPRTAWVDTDGLNHGLDQDGNFLENDLHYSLEGYEILGKRFAEVAIQLIQNQSN